ncbi:MAG: ribbon-helix-helix domain-containing protein [Alphaproteobacteria bacterium]|nr:ribbon-helix-helix domain-containing protein [Alphaproteobacteria bacterium]
MTFNTSHMASRQPVEPAPQKHEEMATLKSSLISRNITLNGHRTSMRLEPAMWNALIEICRREKLSIHQLCSMVAQHKAEESSFTASVRVFAMSYYKSAATEEGHRQAGHGTAFLFTAKQDFAALKPRAIRMV